MRKWLPLVVVVMLGVLFGIGSFTFVYAKGHSYLQDDPAVCGNCHIMNDHLDAWNASSHKDVATCNDCHTPHDPVGKYVVKAKNGFWHSFYFTTGDFPDPLRITPANHEVTEEACRYCHAEITATIDHGGAPAGGRIVGGQAEAFSCTRCHRHVGHWVR